MSAARSVNSLVILRDATEADLDDVADLERRAFPIPWKREYFASELGQPHRFNRVARGDLGTMAGYVFCAYAAGEIHVNKIAVEPRYRRQGVARRLMQDVFLLGARISAEEIYLEVRESNIPAQTFYESQGFLASGKRPAYYLDGENALVLVKPL